MTPANSLIEIEPIKTSSANQYVQEAKTLGKMVDELKIENQNHYEGAASLLKAVKDMAKSLEESRKKITTPLDIAKKAVMDLFRQPADDLGTFETEIKSRMIHYQNEQEKIRQEKEAKLRREAEAEERRLREAKEKQEREWREKEEAARKELEKQQALIAKAKNDKARAEAEALAAKAKAEAERASAKAEERRIEAASVQVVAPTIASSVSKVAGVSTRKDWKAKVLNPLLVPRDYLIVDESKLNKVANATKGSLSIPGVQFYAVDVMASR
jgi:uncharacterized membrane protein YqiK